MNKKKKEEIDKQKQKEEIDKQKQKEENEKIFRTILKGDLKLPEIIFRSMISKGYFPNIRNKGFEYIKAFGKEVSQEIFISFFLRKEPIDYPKAYIRKVILNMSWKEDGTLRKLYFIPDLDKPNLNSGGEDV